MYYLSYTKNNMVSSKRLSTLKGIKNFIKRMDIESDKKNEWSLYRDTNDFHSFTQKEYLIAHWNDTYHMRTGSKQINSYINL